MKLTFVIERHGQEFWLCTTDGQNEKMIAKFICEEAARSFNDVLGVAKAVSYAQGQLGL